MRSLRTILPAMVLFCSALLSVPTLFAQFSTNGPVARWTFDDGTGRDSAGTNDAMLVGSPAMVSSPSGRAMETRATSYAVADSPNLNVSGWTGITVSVWVKPVYWGGVNYGGASGFTTYGYVFVRGNDAGDGSIVVSAPAANSMDSLFMLSFSPTQTEQAVFHTFSPSKPSYPVVGSWYHLVGTYDGQRICTYVNGVLDSSTNVAI